MLTLRNILISVTDLERSKAWYRDNLGFQVEHEQYLPPLDADIAMISNGAVTLELACYKQGAAPLPEARRLPKTDVQTVGVKQFGFFTDDMDALLEKVRENGSEIVYTLEIGKDRVAMIRDCDGVVIELVQAG